MSLDIYIIKPMQFDETKFSKDRRLQTINFLTKDEAEIFNLVCKGSAIPEKENEYYDFHNHIKKIHKSDDTPQCIVNYDDGIVTYKFWDDIIGYYDIIEPLSSIPFLDVTDKFKACYIDLNEQMYLDRTDFIDNTNPFDERFIFSSKFNDLNNSLKHEQSEYWLKRLQHEHIIWMDY